MSQPITKLIQVVGIAFDLIIIRSARLSDEAQQRNVVASVIRFAHSTTTSGIFESRIRL